MKDPFSLIDFCYKAFINPSFLPRDGKTYCNIAVGYIAKLYGCEAKDFPFDFLANEMHKFFIKSDLWQEVDVSKAQDYVNNGVLIIASQPAKPHGHVCILRPGKPEFSHKWGMFVPVCMNIGKDVFMNKGINFAFREIPKLFAWKRSL